MAHKISPKRMEFLRAACQPGAEVGKPSASYTGRAVQWFVRAADGTFPATLSDHLAAPMVRTLHFLEAVREPGGTRQSRVPRTMAALYRVTDAGRHAVGMGPSTLAKALDTIMRQGEDPGVVEARGAFGKMPRPPGMAIPEETPPAGPMEGAAPRVLLGRKIAPWPSSGAQPQAVRLDVRSLRARAADSAETLEAGAQLGAIMDRSRIPEAAAILRDALPALDALQACMEALLCAVKPRGGCDDVEAIAQAIEAAEDALGRPRSALARAATRNRLHREGAGHPPEFSPAEEA
jgi:hypothetical protein